MNSAYIGKLMELAEKDERILHLLADSGTGYDEMFRRNFPNRMFNFGIAEENMVAAAAGMASAGKIPFVFTAGAFLAYRSFEFIRDDVCFQNLNVKIVGMGSGLSWSSLGPTHHTTEDVAVLRSLPDLMILSPASPCQVAECVELAARHVGPVYIRIGMNHERELFSPEYRLSASGFDVLREGTDVCIYVTGSIADEVLQAAEILAQENISCRVVHACMLKPFCPAGVLDDAAHFQRIFTVEEHNIHGGLSSIIAEQLAWNGVAARVVPIGIPDVFASGYGTHAAVRRANALDAASIAGVIRENRQEKQQEHE